LFFFVRVRLPVPYTGAGYGQGLPEQRLGLGQGIPPSAVFFLITLVTNTAL